MISCVLCYKGLLLLTNHIIYYYDYTRSESSSDDSNYNSFAGSLNMVDGIFIFTYHIFRTGNNHLFAMSKNDKVKNNKVIHIHYKKQNEYMSESLNKRCLSRKESKKSQS